MAFVLDFEDVAGGVRQAEDKVTQELISLVPESWTEGKAKQKGGNFWLLMSMLGQAVGLARRQIIESRKQLYLNTATGKQLDRFGRDYFGFDPVIRLPRNPGEADETYRKRIIAEVLREKATISGVIQAVQELTGGIVGVFEPFDATTAAAYHGAFGSGTFAEKFHPYPTYAYGDSQIHAFQNTDGSVGDDGSNNYAIVGAGNLGIGGPGGLGQIYTFYVNVISNPNGATFADVQFLVNRIKPLGTKGIVQGVF